MSGAWEYGLKPLVRGLVLGLLAATTAFAQGTPPAGEDGFVVTVKVMVDPVKANGSPWDGLPAVGGKIIAQRDSNAPDIAFCVVLPAGAPECYWRIERGRTISVCQDARECTIDRVRLPRFPLGLVFLDVDLARHDLIDFVILTNGTPPTDDLEKLEANMRSVMARLTPGNTAADRLLRERKPRTLPLDLCNSPSQKCDLTQSQFWIERK